MRRAPSSINTRMYRLKHPLVRWQNLRHPLVHAIVSWLLINPARTTLRLPKMMRTSSSRLPIVCTTEFTLRTTSGFFRDMISLHQHNTAESCEDTIALDEPSNVLGALLRLISGFGVMKWESYDEVENVLAAAQKYDMTGPLMMIRAAITSPIFMEQPLRLYAIAARYGWEDEAKLASKHSLVLSIHDDEHAAILERIPTPYVLRLFRLHRVRRDEFKKHVTRDHGCFGIEHCPYCGESFQKSPVAVLMNLIIWEMDRRPAGDGLLDGQWKEWPMCKGCRCMQSCTTRNK